jgi:hypothetical protein
LLTCIIATRAGNRIAPLETNPGRVLLTDQRIYFQQLNNIGPNPVDRYALNQVCLIFKRRHSLRPIGLEIFFLRSTALGSSSSSLLSSASTSALTTTYDEAESLYLSFSSTKQRDALYDAMIANKAVQQNLKQEEPSDVMKKYALSLSLWSMIIDDCFHIDDTHCSMQCVIHWC